MFMIDFQGPAESVLLLVFSVIFVLNPGASRCHRDAHSSYGLSQIHCSEAGRWAYREEGMGECRLSFHDYMVLGIG